MKLNNPYLLIVGGNLVALALLYLPFPLMHLRGDGILGAAFFNVILVAINLVAAILSTAVPEWRKLAPAWWASLGALLLLSFPVCLATINVTGQHLLQPVQ